MEFVLATKNPDKVKEARAILEGTDIDIISMEDAWVDVDVIEDGTTFEENAVKKTREVMTACGRPALADDSGLMVDYLQGRPGVYSARFMGDAPYSAKNRAIIQALETAGENERGAKFVCAVAAAFPDGRVLTERGEIRGVIAKEPAGDNGFGFDPIFYSPEFNMTTGQMAPEQKNAVSHRGKALRQMRERLKESLQA